MGVSLSLRSRARQIDEAVRQRVQKSHPSELIALLSTLGLIAIIGSAVLANVTEDKWRDALWLEIAKAGVWVVAVGVVGGALGAIWQNISAHREAQIAKEAKDRDRKLANKAKKRDRRRADLAKEREREIEAHDKLRAELVSLVQMYNGIKGVRRNLRSLGFDPKYPAPESHTARKTQVLSQEQARGFHAQMLVLNGLQLDFESKARQFGQTNLLGDDTERVVKLLGGIENHLNQVLQLWEHSGWTIQEGVPLDVVSNGLVKLFRVREHLRPQVSDPLREITRMINKHVFGEASAETRKTLQGIVSAHENREPQDQASDH